MAVKTQWRGPYSAPHIWQKCGPRAAGETEDEAGLGAQVGPLVWRQEGLLPRAAEGLSEEGGRAEGSCHTRVSRLSTGGPVCFSP